MRTLDRRGHGPFGRGTALNSVDGYSMADSQVRLESRTLLHPFFGTASG